MAQHLFGLLAAAALVRASPFPQGVTMAVAPEASVPAACSTDRAERFGIAVMSAMAGPVVSQIGGKENGNKQSRCQSLTFS